MIYNDSFMAQVQAPVRSINAKVELYNGSALADTFAHDGKLMRFYISRAAEYGRFFGFGVCQHIEASIIDKDREVDYITTAHTLKVSYNDNIVTNPLFYVTQSRRDENTNELTIYGYDLVYYTSHFYSSSLELAAPYTINDVATAIANFMGASGVRIERLGADETCFDTSYDTGANLEGTETLRELLDDIAEATQTIYYMDSENYLVFKRLDKDAAIDLEITKEDYITLDCGEGRRLATVCHATELGDNVSASITASGSTQYVRDNAFWELREDIDTLVENAVAAVGGLSIRQFTCSWRGNPLLEIGDKIGLTTRDNDVVISYVLDDAITYEGALTQDTQWNYEEEEVSASNPSSLGEVLKQTYAKVDKANKQVEIVVSEVGNYDGRISTLELNTEGISASVNNVEQVVNERLEDTNADIATLTEKVNATMSAEEVSLEINKALNNGVSKVETTTGFTFNEDGLSVSKSNSEMQTTITEDGMQIYKNTSEVLTANNEGVTAIDLHAKTYLIIGKNSRFEDYGSSRTGCFWIGG